MTTINYDGELYNEEIVRSYYDRDSAEQVNSDADTPQKFFEEYIKLDPSFITLFEYDFCPVAQ